MRLFGWLRRPAKQQEPQRSRGVTSAESAVPAATLTAMRAGTVSGRLGERAGGGAQVEARDALLRFARDYLAARGAETGGRVRVEEADLLVATLGDGSAKRYTSSLTRAQNEPETELLVEGGAALAAMLDDCAERAAQVALRLTVAADGPTAEVIARAALAETPPDCGRCARTGGEAGVAVALCQRCPAREGRVTLAGLGRLTSVREERRAQTAARSMELTYRVVSSDWHGRRDQWVRRGVALDAGDERAWVGAPTLTSEQIQCAESIVWSAEREARLDVSEHALQVALAPMLSGMGAWLRLRSHAAFARRLDELTATFARLRREGTDDLDGAQDAYRREVERLRDIFAVRVEAQLESVAEIVSPCVPVAVKGSSGVTLTVTVDMGRGVMTPLRCGLCAEVIASGAVCADGHTLCAACAPAQEGDLRRPLDVAGCPVCRGAVKEAATSRRGTAEPDTRASLTCDLAESLPQETWQEVGTWLLEQEGYRLERVAQGAAGPVWYGWDGEAPLVAVSYRAAGGWALGVEETQRAAALRPVGGDGRAVLLSTAPATAEAHDTAQRLGVLLLDREALTERLVALTSAYARERDAAEQERAERAAAAVAARAQLLAALEAQEQALARAGNAQRAGGRAPLLASIATIRATQRLAQQATLAWETLLADWDTSFGAHEARDGTLLLTREAAEFVAFGERAAHLGAALVPALERLAATPGAGEHGYGAWRKAVVEELTARCEGWRWRALARDPERWADYNAAHDAAAAERAASFGSAAAHAVARAEQAFAQLRTRARLTNEEENASALETR